MTIEFMDITAAKSANLVPLHTVLPNAARGGLEQALRTLKLKVQRATPVGLVYRRAKKRKSRDALGKKNTKKKVKRPRGRYVVSGKLKKSWASFSSWRPDQNVLHEVGMATDVPYAEILERGLYPGIGKFRTGVMGGGLGQVSPRTKKGLGGGIFSSRATDGILTPIRDDREFLKKTMAFIEREIARQIKR